MQVLQRVARSLAGLFAQNEKTPAYERGYESKEGDLNPYLEGTSHHADWEAGRSDAYIDAEARAW